MTMRSNDTLVDTSFQLISGFFHVNQGVLCSEHAKQASSRGAMEGAGGGGGGTRPTNDRARPCVAMTPWVTPHFN